MLNAFKIKPFDLEPVFAEWQNPPRFIGNPKKDPPVNDWLKQIKAGCIERKVPREYWHKVAQHYMGGKAKARFDEVKLVMKNMHGGKYRWTWKNFKVAMRNMGWDIEADKTEAIEVESKPSGFWRIIGRGGGSESKEVAPVQAIPPRPPVKSRNTFDFGSTMKNLPAIPTPRRSATTDTVETVSSVTSSSSSSAFGSFFSSVRSTPAATTPATSAITTPAGTPGQSVTTVTQVPAWLVSACQSLEFLTNEHPKVMTALSAILITVGSLPALPAISAGAGGAFLASSTAHALGSLAVGLGTLLQAQTDGKLQVTQGEGNKA
ncbi:hypothetical protein PYCCODRAFT_1365242 [Trametes coccinea BRFM310]|uniref:Uncharacterized protein n=1 Tax=Trametes coccinea (strain BRFM310) TaxID=1353009 RepID=A0A1Y2IT95_TRAC3|nr:hypothetical protein PYCCODRAFT_1365242 [Trametes coccinea BRFM310]